MFGNRDSVNRSEQALVGTKARAGKNQSCRLAASDSQLKKWLSCFLESKMLFRRFRGLKASFQMLEGASSKRGQSHRRRKRGIEGTPTCLPTRADPASAFSTRSQTGRRGGRAGRGGGWQARPGCFLPSRVSLLGRGEADWPAVWRGSPRGRRRGTLHRREDSPPWWRRRGY